MQLGIYGYGGHGLEMEELAKVINRKEHRWERIIFIDDDKNKIDNEKIFSFEDINGKYGVNDIEFIAGIGEPVIRSKIFNKVKEKGYNFAILIHPSAFVAESARIEEGTVICYNAYVSVKNCLGENVLIQPMAVLSHEITVGRNSVVSSFASLGGNSSLGDNSFIGLNACIKQGIRVGNNSAVGMGAVVIREVADRTMVIGNPAKIIKTGDIRVFN